MRIMTIGDPLLPMCLKKWCMVSTTALAQQVLKARPVDSSSPCASPARFQAMPGQVQVEQDLTHRVHFLEAVISQLRLRLAGAEALIEKLSRGEHDNGFKVSTEKVSRQGWHSFYRNWLCERDVCILSKHSSQLPSASC
jgi:hypothetical protein